MAQVTVAQTTVAQIILAQMKQLIWTGLNKFGSIEHGSNDLAQKRRHLKGSARLFDDLIFIPTCKLLCSILSSHLHTFNISWTLLYLYYVEVYSSIISTCVPAKITIIYHIHQSYNAHDFKRRLKYIVNSILTSPKYTINSRLMSN